MTAPKAVCSETSGAAITEAPSFTAEDIEDALLGAAALEAHRLSGRPAIPLDDLMRELGLED